MLKDYIPILVVVTYLLLVLFVMYPLLTESRHTPQHDDDNVEMYVPHTGTIYTKEIWHMLIELHGKYGKVIIADTLLQVGNMTLEFKKPIMIKVNEWEWGHINLTCGTKYGEFTFSIPQKKNVTVKVNGVTVFNNVTKKVSFKTGYGVYDIGIVWG